MLSSPGCSQITFVVNHLRDYYHHHHYYYHYYYYYKFIDMAN